MSTDGTVARRVPGKFWYVVALVIFIASITAPAGIVLWRVFGNAEAVVRLIAPETKTVRLAAGTYTIFSDSRAIVNGEVIISQGGISGLRVSVRNARGEDIPVGPVAIASRYSHGGQAGFAVFEVKIPEAGEYQVAAGYRNQQRNQHAILSLRKDFLGNLLTSIFLAVGVALGGALLATLIFFRTLRRRNAIFGLITARLAQVQEKLHTATPSSPPTRPTVAPRTKTRAKDEPPTDFQSPVQRRD